MDPPPFGIFYCHSVSRICLLILSINTLKLEENYKGELNKFFRYLIMEKEDIGSWETPTDGSRDLRCTFFFCVFIKLMKQSKVPKPSSTYFIGEWICLILFFFLFLFSLFIVCFSFFMPPGDPTPTLLVCMYVFVFLLPQHIPNLS